MKKNINKLIDKHILKKYQIYKNDCHIKVHESDGYDEFTVFFKIPLRFDSLDNLVYDTLAILRSLGGYNTRLNIFPTYDSNIYDLRVHCLIDK
jgi:hypothetical protein